MELKELSLALLAEELRTNASGPECIVFNSLNFFNFFNSFFHFIGTIGQIMGMTKTLMRKTMMFRGRPTFV